MAGIDFDVVDTTDPEALAAAFAQLEGGEEPAPKAAEPPDLKDDEVKTEASVGQQTEGKGAAATEATTDEENAAGIATNNGKHVIPFSVLKSTRDRATRAEQLAAEAQNRVVELERQLQQGTSQGAKDGESARTEAQTSASDLSEEDLQALKEDFPTVYRAVMASMAAAKALETKLAPVEESVRSVEAERAQSTADAVQDAIDSVPKLAHIQASDPAAFDLARQFDATLKSQAAWSNKSLAERFAKVTEMVEAAIGPIELPGTPKPTAQLSAADLAKAAKAKADAAVRATRSNVPTSLSEFPAGQHAAQDEREGAEQMSTLQLAEKFSSMTPDQMDAYFRNL